MNIDYDYIGSSAEKAGKAAKGFSFSQSTLSVLIIVVGVVALVALILGIINLVMNVKNNSRLGNVSTKIGSIQASDKEAVGAVFCKNCGSQYTVSEKQCPYCGARR